MSWHRWGRYCNVAIEADMSCPGTGGVDIVM